MPASQPPRKKQSASRSTTKAPGTRSSASTRQSSRGTTAGKSAGSAPRPAPRKKTPGIKTAETKAARTKTAGTKAPGTRTAGTKAAGSRTPGRSPRARAATSSGSPQPDQPNFLVRRLVVLVIALALLSGVVWGGISLFGWVSGKISDRTAPAPTVETTGPSVEELSHPVQCTAEALGVEMVFPETVAAGTPANMQVTLTNNGEVSCLTDTGYTTTTIRIYSGNELIWDRAHCGHGPTNREILLNVGASDVFTLAWPGARSAEGCPGGLPALTGGTYRVEIAADTSGDFEPLKQVFIVSAG